MTSRYANRARPPSNDQLETRSEAAGYFERLAKECLNLFAQWKDGIIGVFS